MGFGFWFGIMTAIPLSIAANVLTPRVQLAASRWSKKWAIRRKRGMARDLARIKKYRENRQEFIELAVWKASFIGFLTFMSLGALLGLLLSTSIHLILSTYYPDITNFFVIFYRCFYLLWRCIGGGNLASQARSCQVA